MSASYLRTFDEYANHFDVVPRTADAYLRRFRPDGARRVEWQGLSPAECGRRLAKAKAEAIAASRRKVADSRDAPARRPTPPSAAVRADVRPAEPRAATGSPGVLVGYAAMYGRPSVNLGGFVETLATGAFRSTLARIKAGEHDLFLLTEHTQQNVLARVSAGNLSVEEDSVGLKFTVTLPDTQLGRDVRELVQLGVLRGMSFSFSPIRDSWPEAGKRIVHDLTAFEISIVSSPAYPSTSVVASRSKSDAIAWKVAALRALAAKVTRGKAAKTAARSTGGIEWR
jgi:HK97 family phage prohead protease